MLTLGFHCWHLFSEWPCVRLKKVSTWMTSWTNRQLWHGILRLVNPLTALSFQLDWFAWQSRALWMSQWKRHRSALPLPRQRNRTVEGSSTRETVNSATGCNSNQVQEAIRSIRQWAAFRAFKEAKAAGRETFTVEDWQRWMAVAGHSLGNPSDEEFSAKFRFTNLSRISFFFSGIAVFDLINNKQIGINCRKCFLIRKIY